MKQKEVYRVLAQRLGVKRENLDAAKLSDGKIFIEYFKQVFRETNKSILENKFNVHPNEEFSSQSKAPWSYLNEDASLLKFAHLLAVPASRSTANIRAECTRPRISKELLTVLLADQLEKKPEEVDLGMKVREIRLPLANYNKHSWVTFIRWCERAGFTGHPTDLDELADISVDRLFDYWVR